MRQRSREEKEGNSLSTMVQTIDQAQRWVLHLHCLNLRKMLQGSVLEPHKREAQFQGNEETFQAHTAGKGQN